MIGKLFHTPASKSFSFKPRYYDPDKEDRENREERIKEEMGIVEDKKVEDGKPFKASIKGQFRNPDGWNTKSSESGRKSQNRRLFILVVILSLLFYLFFFYDF